MATHRAKPPSSEPPTSGRSASAADVPRGRPRDHWAAQRCGRGRTDGSIELSQRLRRARLLAQLVVGLPMWVMWLAFTVVGAQWLAGIDLYIRSPAWFWWTVAVGVAGMALTVWLPRRFAATPRGARWLARRLDDLAGRGLVRATRELDELARYGREEREA